MAYIYKIVNDINDKLYIGKTEFSIEKRFQEHCRDSKRERAEVRPLYRAMNKYGIENFHIELIEETDKPEEREKYWIEYYGSFKYGYNATIGGDGKAYLDYDLIFKIYQKTHNLTKTAQLCNCSPDSVSKIVKARGAKVSPAISLSKAVGKVDIITGEILEVYNSVNEAERDNGNTRHIAEVCNGKRKTCKGFKWIFLE